MGWETRERGTRYYTRSKRRDGRVLREYVGGGLSGWLAAEGDRIDRERRVAQALNEKEELESLEALVSPVVELSEAAQILLRAHLIADGCHRHKGTWRRAREQQNQDA